MRQSCAASRRRKYAAAPASVVYVKLAWSVPQPWPKESLIFTPENTEWKKGAPSTLREFEC
jgi:hypothetical protein